MWVRDLLDGLWRDECFADWYPRGGRPGSRLPGWPLSACCGWCSVYRTEQAAQSVRCRINFKYALAMELGHPAFHHRVLADVRDRHTEDDRVVS